MRSRLLLLRGINSDQKKSFENLGLITNFRRKYISSRKIIFLFFSFQPFGDRTNDIFIIKIHVLTS